MRAFSRFLLALAVLGLGTSAVLAHRGNPQKSEGVPVTVTVTAVGKDQAPAPVVPANEVVVRQNGDVRRVLSWTPAQGGQAGLDLVVLVDNSLARSVLQQLKEVGDFVRGLPADTRVAVAYANFGSVQFEQEFTTDHEKAANAFHIPSSFPGTSNGVFDSVTELIKKWPATESRRVILFISDGIDTTAGISNTMPSTSMVLQRAIDQAERSGVVVYTVFASGAGRELQNRFLVTNGQGCLSRLAAETGGDSYTEGYQTPLSFRPFLDDLKTMLGQQYRLTFLAAPGSKPGFSRFGVKTEASGVELIAPDHVFVPGAR